MASYQVLALPVIAIRCSTGKPTQSIIISNNTSTIYPAVLTTQTAFRAVFADDTKISQAVQDQLLQTDLHEAKQWYSTWNLQLNPDKCHIMKFMLSRATPTSSQLHHYYLADNTITFSNSKIDLGVIVQCDLSWSEHYKDIGETIQFTSESLDTVNTITICISHTPTVELTI